MDIKALREKYKAIRYFVTIPETNEIAGERHTADAVMFTAKTLHAAMEFVNRKYGASKPHGLKIKDESGSVMEKWWHHEELQVPQPAIPGPTGRTAPDVPLDQWGGNPRYPANDVPGAATGAEVPSLYSVLLPGGASVVLR